MGRFRQFMYVFEDPTGVFSKKGNGFIFEKSRIVPWTRFYFCFYNLPFNKKTLNYIRNYNYRIDKKIYDLVKKVESVYEIKKDNTVIICPYAKSTSMCPKEFWEYYVKKLRMTYKSVRVFTNIHAEEQAIEGTDSMDIPVADLIGLGVMGYKIIGVQSGILDVLRWLKKDIDLTIIYFTEGDSFFEYCNTMVDNRVSDIYIKMDKKIKWVIARNPEMLKRPKIRDNVICELLNSNSTI